jgi:hypothetical protein
MGLPVRSHSENRVTVRGERDAAIGLLAEWCVSVEVNGTGWDDWDEHYKDARYRPGPLREALDTAIEQEKALRGT